MKLSFCRATSSVVLGLLSYGCSGSTTTNFFAGASDGNAGQGGASSSLGGAPSTTTLGGAASTSAPGGAASTSGSGGAPSTSSLGGAATEADGSAVTGGNDTAGPGGAGSSSGAAGGVPNTTSGGEAGSAIVTTANDEAGASGSNDAGGPNGAGHPCANGCCGSAPAAGTVADSIAGFSATQGACGWSYGEIVSGLPPFVELTVYDTTQTQYSSPAWLESIVHPPWLSIQSTLQHPGPAKWIDRRWTSTVSGALSIRGHVAKSDLQGGDGVIAHVRAADIDLWSAVIAFDDSKGKDFDVSLRVTVGTTIDLLIEAGPNSDNDHDMTIFTAVIAR